MTAKPPPARYPALDWLRAAATVAVIGIHVTLGGTDRDHQPLWDALSVRDRFLNVFANSLARFAVASFIAASFFLLARSLAEKPEPYGAVVRKRALRILPAYLFWTFTYMIVQGARVAAGKHSLHEGFWWTTHVEEWAKALFAGVSPNMYHMWFIPMLLALTVAYPVPRALGRGVLAIAAALGFLAASQWVGAHGPKALLESRWEQFWWALTRAVIYAAFAALGWAAYRAHARGISWPARVALVVLGVAAIAFALAVFLEEASAKAHAPGEIPEGPLYFWALYVYPAGLFAIAMFAFSPGGRAPPRLIARLSELSFGIYLAHPLALMLFDPLERRGLRASANGLFLAKIAVVCALAWVLTAAMSRSERLKKFVR